MSGKKLKEILEKANYISIQLTVLSELAKHPMSSTELRELIEGMGGNYEFILPILKRANLVRVERHGWTRTYTLGRMPKERPSNRSSINFSVSIGNPARKPVLFCRVELPIWENVNGQSE